MPRCIYHNEKFEKKHRWQMGKYRFCIKDDECYSALREVQKVEQEKKKKKDWNKEKKVIKESLKSLSDWKADLQALINKIARLIDNSTPCMMCANPNMKRINGCHYHSVGANGTLRFNLFNIWHGCHSCNSERGGNIPGYDIQLIELYGRKKWEYIKFDLVRENKELHLNIDDIKELIPIARQIIKELEKMETSFPKSLRWNLRKKYNQRLKIYK